MAINQGDVIKSFVLQRREEALVLYWCVSPELTAPSSSGVTDVTNESEQYLAPRGQKDLDSAKPSPPGQDQVLSLGMRLVETPIPALTLH